jgi:hypothetical protein
MSLIESPTLDNVQAEVDPTFKALRAALAPLEYQRGGIAGGHFRLSFTTGLVTGVAAAGAIFSLRWADPDRLFALLRLKVKATLTTAFTAAQENSLDLVKLTSYTVADTGGTDLLATLGSSGKKRSSMQNSQLAGLRIATTAALTNGTATADAHPMTRALLNIGNTALNVAEATMFDAIAGQESPLFIGHQEGLRLRILEAQGAAGVVRFIVEMDGAEIPTF